MGVLRDPFLEWDRPFELYVAEIDLVHSCHIKNPLDFPFRSVTSNVQANMKRLSETKKLPSRISKLLKMNDLVL